MKINRFYNENAPAREYHRKPEVTAYFKKHHLNHESGDYRPLWKKLLYPVCLFINYICRKQVINQWKLQKLNNFYQTEI